MDNNLPLVADVLRRKLPETKIAPGEYLLGGTALIDLDVTVAKSEPTEAQPTLPWKSIVAALAASLGDSAHLVIARAARKATAAEEPIPLPQSVEAALEKVRAKMPASKREGPTKVTGVVELVGFVPSAIVLPGWREVKEVITAQRAG